MSTSASNTSLSVTSSWTDDLAECPKSGSGTCQNHLHDRTFPTQRWPIHDYEDKKFAYKIKDDLSFYGLFDGNHGSTVAEFCCRNLPTEVVLDLPEHPNDDPQGVLDVIKTAFQTIERFYFESSEVADLMAERNVLYSKLNHLKDDEAERFPEERKRLIDLDRLVASGSTALIALICQDVLYVANIGDSRLLMCKMDEQGEIKPIQVTNDHSIRNPVEAERLKAIGVDFNVIYENDNLIINQRSTRCLGNYFVKSGYKEFPFLSSVTQEPVSAEAETYPAISLTPDVQFVVIMSYGVYKAYEEILASSGADYDQNQINGDIVQIIISEFKVRKNLNDATQHAVERIARMHQDIYFSSGNIPGRIDDMTLIVINMNYPKIHDPTAVHPERIAKAMPTDFMKRFSQHLTITIEEVDQRQMADPPSPSQSTITNDQSSQNTLTNSTTSSGFPDNRFIEKTPQPWDVDDDGKIAAYVDFGEIFKRVEEAKQQGKVSQNFRI
ncbi:TGF-beta-activated kinase 1 and MAP3K7-binding protein 1 [Halotydeus destructor]|nr:TGF-beta-activated kinase 1 and MAP3K7-binding protein 1 [Halotydeus destructor]